MNLLTSLFRRTTTVLLAAAALVSAHAADVPGRVARLAEFAGEVQLANDYEGWRPIPRNYTVTSGDNLWVSENGRAEFDVGAVQMWFAGGSNAYIDYLDDQQLVARLSQGAMAIRIRAWEQQDIARIMTTHGEIQLLQPGLYFISTDSYDPSVLTVRSGAAEVLTRGPMRPVNRGETVQFDDNGLRYANYSNGVAGFESWVNSRDRRYDRWDRRAGNSVSPWMIGARELDDYGTWESTYEYGRVWYPTAVAAGWAPYRYGRWSWVQPWGWTWVDDANWGFAPFHYGRWVRIGSRWAWTPGSFVGRPVYAPALVTFFGGNGWSVSTSIGPTYSWVPLGWGEPYVPWYTYTPTYWRQVNRPYVRNVAEDPWRPRAYVHASVPGAITAVAGATMLAGRPIRDNYVRNISERDLMSAPPARMGEVVPQFRGAQGVPNRGVAGNNNNRAGLPAPIVRERSAGAAVVAPNVNVLQPRVQDNPAFNQRPQVQPVRPGEPPRSDNPGLRERGVPVAKDPPRERPEPRYDAPRSNEPPRNEPPRNIAPPRGSSNSDYRGNAPAPVAPPPAVVTEPRAAPQPPRAVEVPRPAQAPAPLPRNEPPRVIERSAPAPAVVAPPPQPERPRAEPERPRAPEPPNRGPREKDRAPGNDKPQ